MEKNFESYVKVLQFSEPVGSEAIALMQEIDNKFQCLATTDSIFIDMLHYGSNGKEWLATNLLANRLTAKYPNLTIREYTEQKVHKISKTIQIDVLSDDDIWRTYNDGYW